MAVDHTNDGRRGLGALLRDLAEGSAELVRGEARLASLELGGATTAAAKGTVYAALGGVLLLLGTLAVFTGLILLIGSRAICTGSARCSSHSSPAASPPGSLCEGAVRSRRPRSLHMKRWRRSRRTRNG